ncbi:MAG: Asp-tRNA(Asn)/Glu-tRNA(Gln) amidotransferase subunit GatB [Candidatus Aenigmarchaeota archaeon]|nr:Asp-tRNA(Asn)/Glu-tRNA(Gln) amidotransferase subunit GatB [Candidatus Aenigmarchaeota archaeon]
MKIGLEVHCQLLTQTKLFCRCPNRVAKEPNTLTCDYCTGLPGSKPRLNATAVEYALKIGLALDCSFPKETFFSRKSYFYPDMGKNFQITQYEIPIAKDGFLNVNGKKIRITRIQVEEDPARMVHAGTITHADYVLVDYNRSGVPLCEIVTAPDFSSPKEARVFLQELSSILEYLGVYDSNTEGSMRVDANISVAETRVEVKNISGFKDVEKALQYEIIRQQNLIKRGQSVARETRAWDAPAGVTRSLRMKEGEDEYGYIFEPDLPFITTESAASLKKALPEFAHQKVQRYKKEFGIAKELSEAITSEPNLAKMFEQVVKEIDSQFAAKWFAGNILKTLNFNNLKINDTLIKAENIVMLLRRIREGKTTERTADLILRDLVELSEKGQEASDLKLVEKLINIAPQRIFDPKALEPVVKEVLNENPKAIVDYKSGKKEALNFLVGAVMKKTEGRGDSETIRKLLTKYLA